MDMNNESSYLVSRKCADVHAESAGDYILPDYLGDVRRILFTEASVRPCGRFGGGDELELSGVVLYTIVYLDTDGGLSSAELTTDFDYLVKCSGESVGDAIVDTAISGYSIRPTGPRKISARASLVGSVRLCENRQMRLCGSAFDPGREPELNNGYAAIRQSRVSSPLEREYAESLAKIEGGIAEEISVVYSSAEPIVESVSAEGNEAVIKGKIRMIAVMRSSDEPAYTVEKQIGFEERLELDGITDGIELIPALTVSSVKTSVNGDESGCEVVMSVIVEASVLGESNGRVGLVLDGYLKECATENQYSDFGYTELIEVASVKGSHTAEMLRADLDSEGLREILFLTATPKVERVEAKENRVNLLGEIRYSGVASEMVGDSVSYTGVKFSSPFAVDVNVSCQNSDNIQIESRVKAYNASALLDQDKLYASCTLECGVTLSEEKTVRVLSSMNASDSEDSRPSSVVTVYYPTEGDTLFSVAKRYRTSCLKIAGDNDISSTVFASDNPTGSLSGVKQLLIY